MSSLNTFIDCPDFQSNLNGYFYQNPSMVMEPIVLTSFLTSPLNQVPDLQFSISERVAPGGGKIRTVQLTYTPRFLESDVSVGVGRDDCTSTNKIGETSALYTIEDGDYIQADMLVDYFDLIRRCESNEDYMMRTVQMLIDQVTRKRETILYSDLATMYGAFSANEPNVTANVKDIETRYADLTFNPDGMAEIVTATRYAAYISGPVILGGREMGQYFAKVNAGCCAKDGVNIDMLHAQYGYVFLESYRADDAFGPDNFITVAPGAVQLVEYSEFDTTTQNLNYIDTPQLKRIPIIDPRTGSRYDFKMVMDCNGAVSIFIRSYFKLASLPSDVFYPGDRLYQVNWINKFAINNP